ncbi:MAG: hypothetical protein ISS83_01745 [Candidatus Pacebacteria bacterium]|nr:hypothetical protein [Candidatus Paceibacterota bacterium]
MKINEKIKAIHLRKLGKSYSEIRKKVKASKGALSLWLRDVKLRPEQKKRLYVTLRRINAYKGAKVRQKKRIERTKRIIKEAEKEFKLFFKKPLFLAGLMLYWAEGDKSDEREVVKFTNSDPIMVKFMMWWFREFCKVPENKFKICLHVHKLHCRKNIQRYWSRVTEISLSQFHKTQIKPTSLKVRKNKLYNGTCAITIHRKDLFRRIKGWKLGFIETLNY